MFILYTFKIMNGFVLIRQKITELHLFELNGVSKVNFEEKSS